MITYVDAETKTRRTAGVIPLHGEAGFAGMRRAGALTAQALPLLQTVRAALIFGRPRAMHAL